MSLPTVGFCGLGAMGGGMARHLLSQNFSVTGFDVYAPSAEKLVQSGGKAAPSPAEVASSSDILVIMVTSYSQVTSVLFDGDSSAVNGLRPEAAIIVSSTVPPHYCDEARARLDNEFKRPDVYLLDCPVSGGTPRAANGTLSIFSSGPDAGLEKAAPVLQALSQVLYKIPRGIGFGSKAKMCHQVLPEIEIALANEAMALAARAGLNTQSVFDAVQASDGWSWINGNRIPHMLEGDMTIYSAIPNSQKDSSIIVNTSRLVSFPVPVVAASEQVYLAGIHAGWAKDDDSSLWRLYLDRSHPPDYIHQLAKKTESESNDDPSKAKATTISTQEIIDIFAAGHLAAAVEAMGFTEAVGLDTDVMYDIISKAAGANTQFIEHVPKMKKPSWTLRDVPEAGDIGAGLEKAVIKANAIGASLPVASASLQLIKLHLSRQ